MRSILLMSIFLPLASATVLSSESTKWPNARVPIVMSASFTKNERTTIIDALKEIEEKTCLRFTYKMPDHKDYVFFYKPSEIKCSSFVGRQGGIQHIILHPFCLESRKVILHTIMHALGFIHEFNRPDRDEHVTINYSNILEPHRHNFMKRGKEDVDYLNTAFAAESIMTYWDPNGVRDPNIPAIQSLTEGVKLGGEEKLSDIDVLRINRRYCENA